MVGILVVGDNHFIVRGPRPDPETAVALARFWSLIRIGAETPSELRQWTISSKEFREDLVWAVSVPGEGERNPAVSQLLAEIADRGIALLEAGRESW